MKFKKFGALLLSAVLCIGMAAPAFAYLGKQDGYGSRILY